MDGKYPELMFSAVNRSDGEPSVVLALSEKGIRIICDACRHCNSFYGLRVQLDEESP